MPIPVACQCGRRFAAKDELAGKRLACPACKSPLTIPDLARAAAQAKPQPATPTVSSVAVACRCGQRFQAASHLFGKTLSCPSCRSPIAIPVPKARQPIAAAPVDPFAGTYAPSPFDNDPLGLGNFNATAQSFPAQPVTAHSFPVASLPQYGNYGMPATAAVAPKKGKKNFLGKSAKFWTITASGVGSALVMVFVALWVIGTVARTLRTTNLFPGRPGNVQWITHTSNLGGFSVDIIKPTPGVSIPGLAGRVGPYGIASAYSRQGPGTIANCERLPLPLNDAQRQVALDAWENLVRGGIQAQRGEVTSSMPSTLAGMPARQLTVEVEEGFGAKSIVQFRAAFQGTNAYTLAYVATKPMFNQADADRFFNSFRLLSGTPSSTPTATPTAAPGATSATAQPATVDYAEARKSFRTKLTKQGPAPQPFEPLVAPEGTTLVNYQSGTLTLQAVASAPLSNGMKRPGLLYLHGGFAYAQEDWDQARPFVDAGYVVMIPILRGENGQAGVFTTFYDEVDDVLAAADALARHPDVDARNVFVAGHSAGGMLAALAALTTNKFRACAAYSGVMDVRAVLGHPDFPIVFDMSDMQEVRMRSAVDFAGSFKCPTRLYYGDQEFGYETFTGETARKAKASGLDVEAAQVPGDHMSMLDAAIPQTIAFFKQHMIS